MKRLNKANGKRDEHPEVDAFIADIVRVCVNHGLSIGHEDELGQFVIQPFSTRLSNWLADAYVHFQSPSVCWSQQANQTAWFELRSTAGATQNQVIAGSNTEGAAHGTRILNQSTANLVEP